MSFDFIEFFEKNKELMKMIVSMTDTKIDNAILEVIESSLHVYKLANEGKIDTDVACDIIIKASKAIREDSNKALKINENN